MTLILDLGLDILKMYLCTKNEVVSGSIQKLEPTDDRQLFPPVTLTRLP